MESSCWKWFHHRKICCSWAPFNYYFWGDILFSPLSRLTSACRPVIRPACQKNMSSLVTSNLKLTVTSTAILTIRASHPANKLWLTFVRGRDHSLHSLTLTVFSFSLTQTHTDALQLMHANERRARMHVHKGNPSFHFTVQWSTTLCSTSHKLDKHIYSWFLSREGQSVNSAWQGRHISLSGRIRHAFVSCTACSRAPQAIFKNVYRGLWGPVMSLC